MAKSKKLKELVASFVNMAKSEKLKELVARFVDNSVLGGITQHCRAHPSILGKIGWVLIILVGAGWTSYNFVMTVIQYRMYNSFTAVDSVHYPQLPFPAVSICNINSIHCGRFYLLLLQCTKVNHR